MKIILVVFDGLRPDHVTEQRMPNLAAFAASGVQYTLSHTVFPSETRVAVSSLVTGAWPQSHGIVANEFLDRRAGSSRKIDTGRREDLLAFAANNRGRLLERPSLSQRLAGAGLRHAVVSTASPGASLLLDHQAERLGQFIWSIHGHGNAPTGLAREIAAEFGPVPAAAVPNTPRIQHAARVLVEFVLPRLAPDVTVFWSSEPDISYHERGVGSAEARTAQRDADLAFARILEWWHRSPERAETQIIVASDHGQLTGAMKIEVSKLLREAGFATAPMSNESCDAVILPGPMTSIYARNPEVTNAIQDWLNRQSWCGFVIRHTAALSNGALSMRTVGIEHARTPDLVFTFAGSDSVESSGVAGNCAFDGELPVGAGMHGGLHRRELSNVLIAGGSAFATSLRLDVPAGIIDIAPTIAALLGLPSDGFDGRVLVEGFSGRETIPAATEEIITVAANGAERRLLIRRVGDHAYLAGDVSSYA